MIISEVENFLMTEGHLDMPLELQEFEDPRISGQ